MYMPAHFEESRIEVIRELIKLHPFGSLITHGALGLDATHIPFELVSEAAQPDVLLSHVARANAVWQEIADGDEVLVIFHAGDSYISPNWYPSKAEHHRAVPTWNYRVVHAYGRIEVRHDEKFLRAVVGRLTRTHEAAQPTPWTMSDAARDFIQTQLRSIVGLQIEVTRFVGKSKLGQHKETRDILGPAEALIALGEREIGEAMLQCATKKADLDKP